MVEPEPHIQDRKTRQPFKRDTRVALVSMPFASARRPSIQLGLLSAIARDRGFDTQTFHLNLDLAARIGIDKYHSLDSYSHRLVGEWLFSLEAFAEEAPDLEGEFVEKFSADLAGLLEELEFSAQDLRRFRTGVIVDYLNDLEAGIAWDRFRVVGFSSTFQQNAASIALARRIKRKHPDICIVLGGPNLEGPMGEELVRNVAAIDFVFNGEADKSFPDFLQAMEDGTDPLAIPGVLASSGPPNCAASSVGKAVPLDGLPVPSFDEYFARAESLGLENGETLRGTDLPIETARGCWWGQKHHCTFCGLNGIRMAYRTKSPARVLGELAELSRRHRCLNFMVVDNILDISNIHDILEPIATNGFGYRFFFETKSNLNRDQIRTLWQAGVRGVQPGIESLSTDVLALMRKGVSAIQNVNFLRWARYYGIEASWNILWGLPGEKLEHYERQARLAPNLIHLDPPLSVGEISLERHSPLFTDRDSLARFVGPDPSCSYVYPGRMDLMQIASSFEFEFENALPETAYEPLRIAAQSWQRAWRNGPPPTLTFRASPEFVHLEDRRAPSSPLLYSLDGPLAGLYVAFSDRPNSATGVKARLDLPWSEREIEDALDKFCEQGLMMRDGNLFLSLAIPYRGPA